MMGREHFSSNTTAIMALAGSAIGLGNIWRFPFIVGQNGGAAFIAIYILCAIFLALPIFLSEAAIGRTTQSGTFGAIEKISPGNRFLKGLGMITVISPLIILSYYSVVGGWSLKYLFTSLTVGFDEEVVAGYGNFVSSVADPMVCHTIFLLFTAVIVMGGVKSGIEVFNKISIPILFLLVAGTAVYSLTLPGAMEGVLYLVRPDFSKVTPETVLNALGQCFFSLSLGVGTVLTYSSYMKKDSSLMRAGLGTTGFDLLFAILAGFAIMPAVFSAGIEPGSGPKLIFETLPFIFVKMGDTLPFMSALTSVLFFLTITVAAVTSSISMLEVGVAYLMEEKKYSRKKAVAVIFSGTWILGALCSLSFGPLSGIKLFGKNIFGFCDSLVSNFLMVVGALMFVFLAGWKMNERQMRKETGSAYFFIRYVSPFVIIAIFLSTLFL